MAASLRWSRRAKRASLELRGNVICRNVYNMWVSINSLSVWYQKIPFLVFFATDWYLSLLKVKSNFPLPRLLSCNMCGVSQVLILKSFVGAISLQKCLCLTFVLLFYLCLNHILKLGAEQLYAPLDFPLIKVSCNLCLFVFFSLLDVGVLWAEELCIQDSHWSWNLTTLSFFLVSFRFWTLDSDFTSHPWQRKE